MHSERRRQNRIPNIRHQLPADNPLSQLQQAVQQVSPLPVLDASPTSNDASTTAEATPLGGGACRLLGAGHVHLRTIVRNLHEGPDLALIDTSAVSDLSWAQDMDVEPVGLDPNGQPWLYPRRKSRKDGSNLDDFKNEIEEMTINNKGCNAIAEALIARGVETNSKAIGRQRMKWGLRQRAPKQMTEQGLANIRKTHEEQKRKNTKPAPIKRVQVRVVRKAEITRMTNAGMSATEIAENFMSRGVKMKRGAATIERLRTVWGLDSDPKRNVASFRAKCRKDALKEQKEQFENIATELGIEDVDAWVKSKMEEEIAIDARLEYAYILMDDLRPVPIDPSLSRPKRQYIKTGAPGRPKKKNTVVELEVPENFGETSNTQDQHEGMAQEEAAMSGAAETDSPQEIIELSEDDEEEENVNEDMNEDVDEVVNEDEDEWEHDNGDGGAAKDRQTGSQGSTNVQQLAITLDVAEDENMLSVFMPTSPVSAAQPPSSQAIHASSVPQSAPGSSTVATPQSPAAPDPSMAPLPPHPPNSNPALRPLAYNQATITIGPAPQAPQRTSFVNIAPRPPANLVRGPPPAGPPPDEAKYMAEHGLYAFPNYDSTTQSYLTPRGKISVHGYEYLPLPHPPLPPPPIYVTTTAAASTPPVQAVPPPPPPKVSNIAAPPLVIPPAQIAKHKVDLKAVESYHKATKWCMDLLAARAESRPLSGSLTGMPPSLKDIQSAKNKVKDAATVVLATF